MTGFRGCGFTLDHYEDLLGMAKDTFELSTFDSEPDENRRLYLRHDIDVSVENAVEMAQIEADKGVASTYFVAINSPYYNLLNDSQVERLRQIADYGHTIGIHIDERAAYMDQYESLERPLERIYAFLDEILPVSRVISFHMPSQYNFERDQDVGSFINCYGPTYNDDETVKYISDSNKRWREGCLCEHLMEPQAPSYQVLIHPMWWNDRDLNADELYDEFLQTNKKGLRVNLKNDIQIFEENI